VSNIHPIRLGEILVAAGALAPVYVRRTVEGYAVYTVPPGLLVRLRKSVDGISFVFEAFVEKEGIKLEHYTEMAVLCKECWEPVTEYMEVKSNS